MKPEERIARLESQVRAFKRLFTAVTMVVVVGLCAGAVQQPAPDQQPASESFMGKVSFLDKNGVPKMVFQPDGTVEIRGKLVFKDAMGKTTTLTLSSDGTITATGEVRVVGTDGQNCVRMSVDHLNQGSVMWSSNVGDAGIVRFRAGGFRNSTN